MHCGLLPDAKHWQAARARVAGLPAIAAIDNPPASVLDGVGGLRGAFDAAVPAKAATHLLLGTWKHPRVRWPDAQVAH